MIQPLNGKYCAAKEITKVKHSSFLFYYFRSVKNIYLFIFKSFHFYFYFVIYITYELVFVVTYISNNIAYVLQNQDRTKLEGNFDFFAIRRISLCYQGLFPLLCLVFCYLHVRFIKVLLLVSQFCLFCFKYMQVSTTCSILQMIAN